ncbi:MAG TPA: nuclear transport factor 2 family protein [Solirubrobacteraceae bacterium]|nr:nuclear transport factor 2 family protein [Solirubrobacteraceae bacterium]
MSGRPSERVDVVRRVLDLWATGGDPLREGLIAPDVVYANPADAVDAGDRHGVEGWRGAMSNFGRAFEITGIHVVALEEVGDRVLALVEMETRGRGSGLVATRPLGFLFDVHDGRVTRLEWHNGHAPAREAAARGGG